MSGFGFDAIGIARFEPRSDRITIEPHPAMTDEARRRDARVSFAHGRYDELGLAALLRCAHRLRAIREDHGVRMAFGVAAVTNVRERRLTTHPFARNVLHRVHDAAKLFGDPEQLAINAIEPLVL